jgi:tetratricopeptide (TPR) repeat protein
MSSANPAQLKAKYAIEAQATTLFAFLRQTFSRMPRSVQVIGWLVLLLLFVFLVLYPIIGITYFHVKVITLKRDQQGQAIQTKEQGLRVHKDAATVTNEEGEFMLAVRVPNIPLMGVEFDFGAGERSEFLSLPGPLPLVSMFNPNTRKIFYVPGSNVKNEFGVTKRFFLDSNEAGKAFRESTGQKEVGSASGESSLASLLIERLGRSGVAHAGEQQYREPTYTLRLRELNISGTSPTTNEIYFEILIDGAAVQFRDIPHAGSRKADYLTVFGGLPIKFQEMDIPLSKPSNRVEIAVISNGFVKDIKVGSAEFQFKAEDVGKIINQKNKSLELTVELMPPVALKYTSLEQSNHGFHSLLWLDVPREYLKDVSAVRYGFPDGPSFGFPAIKKQNYFSHATFRRQPEKVTAQITFASGSSIKLNTYLEPKQGEVRSVLDYYAQAKVHWVADDYKQALEWVDRTIQLDPSFAPPYGLKAGILADSGKYEEAMRWYDRAFAADPRDTELLNSYAWTIADLLPNATTAQLVQARQRAELAASIIQDPNYYDTLGWIQFKLREYPAALQTLMRASEMEARLNRSMTTWQDINSHLGHVYLQMGKKQEAREAFRVVVEYAKAQGYFTNSVRIREEDAKVQLKKLQ